MTQQPSGIHHIAVMAADIKTHIAFFADVMGFPLVALFDMHGVPGGLHAFLRMADSSYFSIVQLPGTGDIPIQIGITHAGRGELPSAPGTMQHLAFKTDSKADLLRMRDRIRSHGVNVIGPLDHGFCDSIYFAGPDQLTLEVAASKYAIDADRWIDPAVLARAGISSDEAAGFRTPAPFAGASPVPQPAFDPAKPHMAYPPDIYRRMIAATDAMITASGSFTETPVPA